MSDKQLKSNMPSVPIWKKMNLTVEEASEYLNKPVKKSLWQRIKSWF